MFTNGCFDILHAGHVCYLAAQLETAHGLTATPAVRLSGSRRSSLNKNGLWSCST